jgi:hypothetical protein
LASQARRQLARGAALVPLALVALLLVFPATAQGLTRASGSLDGSGTAYTLTVQNTGDQPIYCMRFFASSGVKIKSVLAPGTPQGSNGFSAETNIAPGGSQTFSFTTEQQYPPGSGGTLEVSTTCSPGSDVTSQVTGPPEPPVGPPEQCRCFAIGANLRAITILAHHGRHLSFRVRWGLICTAGPGPGCRGRIKLATSDKQDVKFLSPKSKTVRCKGRCGAFNHGSKEIRLLLSKKLRPLSEAVHKLSPIQLRKRIADLKKTGQLPYPQLRVGVKLFCLTAAGKEHPVKFLVMTFKFDGQGQVNRRRSDLNGDGREDAPPHKVVRRGP